MSANPEFAQFQPQIATLRLGYGHTTEQAQEIVQSGLQFIGQLPQVTYRRGGLLCQDGSPTKKVDVLRSGQ